MYEEAGGEGEGGTRLLWEGMGGKLISNLVDACGLLVERNGRIKVVGGGLVQWVSQRLVKTL